MHRIVQLVVASLVGLGVVVSFPGPAFALDPASARITDLQITGATLDVRTGVARVDAVVTCSEPMELRGYSVIYQGRGQSDHTAASAGGTALACGPTPTTFSVEDTPLFDGGTLIPSAAHVNVFVESSASPSTTYLGNDRDLRLRVAQP